MHSETDDSNHSKPILLAGRCNRLFGLTIAGDLRIGSDRIESYLSLQENGLAELRVLGPVMSYWLERHGLLTLHAAAVEVGSGAVAFVSRHGGGKSGLGAGMIATGASLLAD